MSVRSAVPIALLVTLGAALSSAHAEAGVLPLVEDARAGAAEAWWVSGESSSHDAFFFSLFERGASGACATPSAAAATPLSRVLRTGELSANNARSIGSVVGCSHVFWGRITEEPEVSGVAWLSLRRTTLRFRGRLVHVATGSVIQGHDIQVGAFAATAADAQEEAYQLLLVDLRRRLARVQEDPAAELEGIAEEELLVVQTGGAAAAYVALLAALPDRVPGVLASEERWATEGRVGVRLRRSTGNSWEDVATGLHALQGVALPGVVVRDVRRQDRLIIVDVARPEADDERL